MKIYSREARSGNREVLETKPLKAFRRRKQALKRRCARYYQVEAVKALLPTLQGEPGARNGFLIMPTASGKSLVMVTLATEWIAQGYRVLIVVPQRSIQGGFASQEYHFEDRVIRWARPCNLAEDQDSVPDFTEGEISGLLEFLAYPLDYERTRICTYMTFRAAFQAAPELFADRLFVVLDEAHHLSSDGEEKHNTGGMILRAMLNASIPHMLCTATPYRADGNYIVPRSAGARYITYVRQRADHVAEFVHVDSYKTEVRVGDALEELEAKLRETRALGKKVLISLPHVHSDHSTRLSRQLRGFTGKDNKLAFERKILALCQKLGLTAKSVVSFEDYQANDAALREAFSRIARDGSQRKDLDAIPDVTLVQERYKEGTDCVAWSVCIQLGLSESCVTLAQFPGRVLRDHWTKQDHSVEFLTLIPDYARVASRDKFVWSMDVIKSLLVLSFMDLDLLHRFRFPSALHQLEDMADDTQEEKRAKRPERTVAATSAQLVTPATILDAWSAYQHGTATTEELRLLKQVIPDAPSATTQEMPLEDQPLAELPKLMADSSCVSDDVILHQEVTAKVIALGATITRSEARQFRNELARVSIPHLYNEIETLYAEQLAPEEISAMLELKDPGMVRRHLLQQRLLRPKDNRRPKIAVKRKRIPGTILNHERG